MQKRHLTPLALLALTLLCACSRTQQPIVDAVKPMQQTLESAKGVEQTLQQQAADKQKAIEQ